MTVLLIDTAGAAGEVLLARIDDSPGHTDSTTILGRGSLEPRRFSVELIAVIEKLLRSNGLKIGDLDALAVISGPGSFTGLRVGLSAVKGIAEATQKPIIAISRLAAVAAAAGEAGLVHAVLDAGRGEFFHGAYRDNGWTCISESLESRDELISALRQDAGAVAAPELSVIQTLAEFVPRSVFDMSAQDALPLVARAWRESRFSDVAGLDANYLRRANPEEARKRGSQRSSASPE